MRMLANEPVVVHAEHVNSSRHGDVRQPAEVEDVPPDAVVVGEDSARLRKGRELTHGLSIARRATSAKSKVAQPMPGYGFCGKAIIGTSPMPRSAKNFFRKRAGTPQAMMPSGRSDPKSSSASYTISLSSFSTQDQQKCQQILGSTDRSCHVFFFCP